MRSLRQILSLILVLAMILCPLGSTVFAAPKGNPGNPFLENGSQPPGRANAPLTQEASNETDREKNTKPAKVMELPSAAANKKNAYLPEEMAKPLKVINEQSDEFLVQFRPGTPAELKRSINANNKVQEKDFIPGIHVHLLATPPGKSAAEMIQLYQKNPNVAFAEHNYTATTQMTPNDPYFATYQTGLQNTEPIGAWEVTVGCPSVTIAVLDTGIDYNHADLAGRVVAGYDFINNDSDAMDDRGHGTHVAGIIGAATGNSKGIAGTTWTNPMMPVKVLNSSGSGTYAGVAQGIIYAADNGAKVINMSLGGSSSSTTLESALQYAYDKGVVLVAAAGNSGGAVMYPAAYPTVIAVGAVDDSDVRASFSCYGPELSVAAPGVQVWSTIMSSTQNAYGTGSGTSFSAPFVAGLAGLILSVNPDLTPAQIQDLIQQGADDLGAKGWDQYYGWGRINMTTTLALVGDAPQPQPQPEKEPEPEPVPEEPAPDPEPEPEPEPAPTTESFVFSGNVPMPRQGNTVSHSFAVRGSGTLEANLNWNQKRADLILYLYGPGGNLLAVSRSSNANNLAETITQAVTPGTYTLKIEAVTGKANYTLNVTSPL